MKNRIFGTRVVSVLLSMIMLFSMAPVSAFAERATIPTTKDLMPLITDATLEGVLVDDEGNYHVQINHPYNIILTFRENSGTLEMDMSDTVHFELPEGVVAAFAVGTIEIGVKVDGSYRAILHDYTIQDNVVTITWNKNNEYFDDLAHAHNIEFVFAMQAQFDGSSGSITFGEGGDVVIKVDNTGSVTITKIITGLKSDVTLTDEQKKAMTFELRNADGDAVKSFTYADMTDGTITFTGIDPGDYTVVETGHPDFTNYYFDKSDSKLDDNGALPTGGLLNLALSNDYDYYKGNLELNKVVSFTNWDNTHTIPDGEKENIKFIITGPYGYSKTVSYADFTEGKLTLSNLDIGTYTIKEMNLVNGYTWTYKVNGVAPDQPEEHPSATATVTEKGTASASFENTYVQKTADLKIKKTATGATVPAGTKFTVTYPDKTTTRTFYYSDMNADGEYVISDVPLGTYTVTEDLGTAAVASCVLTVTGNGTVTAELSNADETKTAEINNKYSPYSSLKVAKTIGAGDLSVDDLTEDQKTAIVFDIYDSANNKVGSMTYADILAGNDTFFNLPVGIYKIKETAPEIPGYTMATSPSSKEVTVEVKTGEAVTGSFTNTYTKDEYKITVNKVFGEGSAFNADNLPDDFRTGTIFTIKKGNTIVASCTYAELSAKLTGLVMADEGPYSITETNPAVPGIAIKTEVSLNGGAFSNGNGKSGIYLTNHGTDVITFRNTYTIQGVIMGDKKVEGLFDADEKDLREKLRYSIYRVEGNTTVLVASNIPLEAFEDGLIVPAGTYFVQETDGLEVSGYDGPEITTQVGADGPIKDKDDESSSPSSTYPFEVKQNQTVDVHFTNKYTTGVGAGHMSLIKYVRGLDGLGTNEIPLTKDSDIKNEKGKKIYDVITFTLEEYYEKTEGVYDWREYVTFKLEELLEGKFSLRPGKYRITEQGGDIEGYDLHVDFIFYNDFENIEHPEDAEPNGSSG